MDLSQELINTLQEQLLRVSTLTELAESRSAVLYQEVKNWMKTIERALVINKIAVGAQISAYRAILISVERDWLLPEDLTFHREPTRTKLKRAAAIVFMLKTIETIKSYLYQMSIAYGNQNKENQPE